MVQLDLICYNNSNDMMLGVFGNVVEGYFLLCVMFDNLGKGVFGVVVQNLDLMLGVC